MRTSFFMRCTLLLLAIASPLLVNAQFKQPTPEELKMTADPKAPGTAAVYLNIDENAADPYHYEIFYARIKVLTEKGKELATVTLPYFKGGKKVSEIKGRTIHADGTVIPLTVKPEDLLVVKHGEAEVGKVVFTLPSVEVGSILEYRYVVSYDVDQFSTPYWEIQRPYFVHSAHFQFTPFGSFMPTGSSESNTSTSIRLMDRHGRLMNSLAWWSRLPPGVKVKQSVSGFYSVDVTDVPPIPDEEWTPPTNSILYKVGFYYLASNNPNEFWMNESKSWSKDVDNLADPSKTLKSVVSTLILPTDSDLDKARKLYAAVQALDNTDFSRQKSKDELKQLNLKSGESAKDTWERKSGSSKEIALLYLAMLRAAGLTAYEMKVTDRSQRIFDPGYLDFDQLDDDLVILTTGGNDILLDPGEKMCPFQTVHWKHSGAAGIRQNSGVRSISATPEQVYTDNKTTRSGDLTLDEHGAIAGTLRFSMNGQQALNWRQTALRNDPEEVTKQFDRWIGSIVPEGVEAHVDRFTGLDDPSVNLVAFVNVHGTLGSATSKRLLLPGFFFETRAAHPFVNQEKRLEPVDMHYGELITDQVTYHLPASLTVEGAPQNAEIPWPQHALFITKSASAPGKITVARMISRAFTFAKPDEYQDLRGFYQKVAAADQQQLVLISSPVAKGN